MHEEREIERERGLKVQGRVMRVWQQLFMNVSCPLNLNRVSFLRLSMHPDL